MKIIILVDGDYPTSSFCREMLSEFEVVCCDGAAATLLDNGMQPYAIVGDMDSLSQDLQDKYKDIVHKIPEQESNDMTKAFTWAKNKGFTDFTFMGLSGKREDHFIANIALLYKYADENPKARIEAYAEYGKFYTLTEGKHKLKVGVGRTVSIFDFKSSAKLWSQGLEYPLNALTLQSLNAGTLNKTLQEEIVLTVEGGSILVYTPYEV